MYSFEGNYKPRKNVNLQSHSSIQKGLYLNQVHEERRLRQEAREREDSIQKFQFVIRKWLVNKKIYKHMMKDLFLPLIQRFIIDLDLETLNDEGDVWEKWIKASRLFKILFKEDHSFLYNNKERFEYFIVLCKYLIKFKTIPIPQKSQVLFQSMLKTFLLEVVSHDPSHFQHMDFIKIFLSEIFTIEKTTTLYLLDFLYTHPNILEKFNCFEEFFIIWYNSLLPFSYPERKDEWLNGFCLFILPSSYFLHKNENFLQYFSTYFPLETLFTDDHWGPADLKRLYNLFHLIIDQLDFLFDKVETLVLDFFVKALKMVRSLEGTEDVEELNMMNYVMSQLTDVAVASYCLSTVKNAPQKATLHCYLACLYFHYKNDKAKQSDLVYAILMSGSSPGHFINSLCQELFFEVELSIFELSDKRWYSMILLMILLNQYFITMTDHEFMTSPSPLTSIEFYIYIRRLAMWILNTLLVYCLDKGIDVLNLNIDENSYLSLCNVFGLSSQVIWKIYARNQRTLFMSDAKEEPFDWTKVYLEHSKSIGLKDTKIMGEELSALYHSIEFGENEEIKIGKAGPLLLLLKWCPMLVPFEKRVWVFNDLIEEEEEKSFYSSLHRHRLPHFMFDELGIPNFGTGRLSIRRGHEFEDGYEQLLNNTERNSSSSSKWEVRFIDEFGLPERGLDGGGLFKEFMSKNFETILDPNLGLFVCQSEAYLPNDHTINLSEEYLNYFEYVGMLVGQALRSQFAIGVDFHYTWINKWLKRKCYLEDLKFVDAQFYKNLVFLKEYSDVSSLALNFTFQRDSFSNIDETIKLVPGGNDLSVNDNNKLQYIYAMANYKLNTVIEKQTRAFIKGMEKSIPLRWLGLFTSWEISTLISGRIEGELADTIDVDDWMANTVYHNFSYPRIPHQHSKSMTDDVSETIKHFWEIVREMRDEDRALLLVFCTASKRPPLFGFSKFSPLFCISNMGIPVCTATEDELFASHLPTAATCVNMLRLPDYKNKEVLKEKLLYAIRSQTGFDFS